MREVIQIGDTLKLAVFHFLTRSYATKTNVLSDSSGLSCIIFLVSDAAGRVTGIVVPVCGRS